MQIFSGLLALCITLLIAANGQSPAVAQVSPLSPLTVATPVPQNQPQILPTDTPVPTSPLPAGDAETVRDPIQPLAETPVAALGEPFQAPPSLILVGGLLVGLGLLIILVLVVRRRE
ncbi:MAG: hypothetical protein WBO46_07020 [Caldilineaceae bacterium]